MRQLALPPPPLRWRRSTTRTIWAARATRRTPRRRSPRTDKGECRARGGEGRETYAADMRVRLEQLLFPLLSLTPVGLSGHCLPAALCRSGDESDRAFDEAVGALEEMLIGHIALTAAPTQGRCRIVQVAVRTFSLRRPGLVWSVCFLCDQTTSSANFSRRICRPTALNSIRVMRTS